MIQPLFSAVAQLNDRVFLGVVWRSLVLSLAAFAGLLASSVWLVQIWADQGGWIGWLLGLLGGIAVLLLAVWFYVPVALLIATLYLERIAAAVERRFYHGLAASHRRAAGRAGVGRGGLSRARCWRCRSRRCWPRCSSPASGSFSVTV